MQSISFCWIKSHFICKKFSAIFIIWGWCNGSNLNSSGQCFSFIWAYGLIYQQHALVIYQKGFIFIVFYVVLGVHLVWNKMNSLVSSYLTVLSEGRLPLLHWLCNYSTSPFLWLGDSHNNSVFQSHLLCKVFFPSSVPNLFHLQFVLALQTVTTFFYCHRSGISFPALRVGFVLWPTTCQMVFHKNFIDCYYWRFYYTAPLVLRS